MELSGEKRRLEERRRKRTGGSSSSSRSSQRKKDRRRRRDNNNQDTSSSEEDSSSNSDTSQLSNRSLSRKKRKERQKSSRKENKTTSRKENQFDIKSIMEFPVISISMQTSSKIPLVYRPKTRSIMFSNYYELKSPIRNKIYFTLRTKFLDKRRKKEKPIVVSRDPSDYGYLNNIVSTYQQRVQTAQDNATIYENNHGDEEEEDEMKSKMKIQKDIEKMTSAMVVPFVKCTLRQDQKGSLDETRSKWTGMKDSTTLKQPCIINPRIDSHSGFDLQLQTLLEWFGSTTEILNNTLPPAIYSSALTGLGSVVTLNTQLSSSIDEWQSRKSLDKKQKLDG